MNPVYHLGRWVLITMLCAGSVRAAESPPTFASWRAACARLPLNRVLDGRMPRKALLPLQKFDEFDRVLDAYFALATHGPMSNATNWVETAPRRETFFNVARAWFTSSEIPFEPFAEKLVLPPDSKIFLQGDLHGDVHSLLAVLGRLQERGWLDGFKITEPGLHIIFLGDYTDRGLYGVEVLYTLLRLRLENPDCVHFVRGNHEDVSLAARYGFLAEGQAKYGPAFNAKKVLRAYDFLPAVIYLGTGTDFVQLCHGGMEPGFTSGPLLTSPGTNRFQLLGRLRQARFVRDNPGWLDGGSKTAQLIDFIPTGPTTPGVIGFMWNDFTVFSDEPAFAHDPDRGFVYGRGAVRYLLRSAGRGEAKVHAVIRAHQHSSIPNPLMRRLVASRGIFRHWQEPNSAAENLEPPALATIIETSASRVLPEDSVWTLNVAPDSAYGAGCGFSFATFGVLKLGAQFGDWRIAVETVDVPTR